MSETNPSDAELRQQLRNEAAAGFSNGSRMLDTGRDFMEMGQLMQDICGPLGGLADAMPIDRVNRTIRDLKGMNAAVAHCQPPQAEVRTLKLSTYVMTNTVASDMICIFPTTIDQSRCREQLANNLGRLPLVEKAIAELKRLVLDRPIPGERNALDFLCDSKRAIDLPVTPENGIGPLVSLRECMDTAAKVLVNRLPTQAPSGKGVRKKILAIGAQCAVPSCSAARLNEIADDAHAVNDELCDAKQVNYSRVQLTEVYSRALATLIAFLAIIDETKLK